ncbi:hypothetical protein VTK73DRAFT_7579 [Phialemonium thermophilum]|uniref:Uncharacterized protein n=1 Tax=Phialemonium thermophilum TaxID=223376 RepID=A0ABR3WDR7_9PEZI
MPRRNAWEPAWKTGRGFQITGPVKAVHIRKVRAKRKISRQVRKVCRKLRQNSELTCWEEVGRQRDSFFLLDYESGQADSATFG